MAYINKKRCALGVIITISLLLVACFIENRITVNDASFIIKSEKTARDVLQINNAKDWVDFADTTRHGNDYLGKTVYLNTDLDYDDILEYIDLQNNKKRKTSDYIEEMDIHPSNFRGVFNGKGHTIYNLKVTGDDKSGLFADLEGAIANLQLMNGIVQGEYAGAIVAELKGGLIVNCCSYVDIEGKTESGLYGDGYGNMENCVSYYNYTIVNPVELNKSILGINERNRIAIDCFSTWEKNDENKPVLSDEFAPIDILFEFDDKRTVSVRYSEAKDRYICPMPSGFQAANSDMRITLVYPDREEEYVPAYIDDAYWFDWGGNIYVIEYADAGVVPSLFLTLDNTVAYEWMRNSKETAFSGEYWLYDETGKIDCLGGVQEVTARGHNSYIDGKKIGLKLNLANTADMLGMDSDKHWVLLPAERDNSFLSYMINNDLGNAVGMDDTPKQKPVQLYVNDRYVGLYLLSERIEIDTNRFNLSKAISLDGERSFLVELFNRKYVGEEPKHPLFYSENEQYMLRYPREVTELQTERIAEILSRAENAIALNGEKDEYGKTYLDYIDVDSFAKQWLMLDFAREESLYSSLYYYRDVGHSSDNLLHAVKPWDVEHSYIKEIQAVDLENNTSYLFKVLVKNPDFIKKTQTIWGKDFLPVIAASLNPDTGYVENGLSSIDYYVEKYRVACQLDQSVAYNDIELKAQDIRTYFEDYTGLMSKRLSDILEKIQR